jgi:hypothetical protein
MFRSEGEKHEGEHWVTAKCGKPGEPEKYGERGGEEEKEEEVEALTCSTFLLPAILLEGAPILPRQCTYKKT